MVGEAGQRRGRLKNKIMVMAILPLLAAQGLMVGLVYLMGTQGLDEARGDLLQSWTERSKDVAQALAYTIEKASLLGNRTGIQVLVEEFVTPRPDLKLLNVYLPNTSSPVGYTIGASSDPSLVGQAADQEALATIATGQVNQSFGVATVGGVIVRTLRVIAPIHNAAGNPVASTSLTWSLAQVDVEVGRLQRAFLTNLLIGAISLLGVSVLVFVMVINEISGRITRPLATLRSAAEAISTGNFDTPIDASSDDEIADLAESFERMTASLRFADRLRLRDAPGGREK